MSARVVLVTGAARGIGRAIAERFARAGDAVALLDRDGREAEAVSAALATQGHRALALQADVADRAAVRDAVAHCAATLGRLDVLVSNAGFNVGRAIDEYSDEEIDRLIAVNLKGAITVVREAVPRLRESRGSIVAISSMTALVGQAGGTVYAATKGAIVSLTRALALELGADGIRVNCVCPAGVDTPLMREWAATFPDPEAVLRGQAAMHLTNRMATPDEIAAAVFFLASADAAFITGVALPVEGGATLGYRRTDQRPATND